MDKKISATSFWASNRGLIFLHGPISLKRVPHGFESLKSIEKFWHCNVMIFFIGIKIIKFCNFIASFKALNNGISWEEPQIQVKELFVMKCWKWLSRHLVHFQIYSNQDGNKTNFSHLILLLFQILSNQGGNKTTMSTLVLIYQRAKTSHNSHILP